MSGSPRIGIVGSGPAAAGAAAALIAAGHRVVVLDVGERLDAFGDQIKRELAATPTGEWTPEMIQRARGDYRCTPDGLEVKKQFGSDFSTRFPAGAPRVVFDDVEHIPSFAFGGLSNIWGSSVMPYRPEEIADWPLRLEDLFPHYRAVARIVGSTGEAGDPLTDLFPCVHENLAPLPMSRAGAGMLARMKRHRTALVADGLHCGMARVAMKPGSCRRCGLCMHGCPDDLIYSSSQTFADWIAAGHVDYQPGIVVERFRESDGLVEVECRSLAGERQMRTFDRLFVAAGVIPTASIVLSSLGQFDTPVTGKDSHYFLFPLLRLSGSGDVRREALQTLSQIFIDVTDESWGSAVAHCQIYSYSDIIDASVRAMLGPLAGLAPAVLSHLLIAQVFLHSDVSAQLIYKLKKAGDGAETLHVSSETNPESAKVRTRVFAKFLRHALRLGAVAGVPFAKVGTPGRGLHCGSTFPMSASPGGVQTDLLGRLRGFSRVHLVDSSVLPSIPGTTIALSSMANAHRIASAALKERP